VASHPELKPSRVSRSYRLCYITDRHQLTREPLLGRIQHAARAGVDLLQVREKDMETRDLLELVKSTVDAVSDRGAGGTKVVVNDRLDVALAGGTQGVHLGTKSMPAQVVRGVVSGNFLVGVSCHSLEEALAAECARADYILLGPIFETPSKLQYGTPLGLIKLRETTRRVKTPVLALGGITVERVGPCLANGAVGIAGIRIFQDCESMENCVRELLSQFPPS
jgi:thiamine-phosphate pyrophosphorylase